MSFYEASMEYIIRNAVKNYRKGKWDREKTIAYVTKEQRAHHHWIW